MKSKTNNYDYEYDFTERPTRADRLMSTLCNEVDMWREEAEFWKAECMKERQKNVDHVNESIKQSWQTVGGLFKVLLNSEQTEQGLLIRQTEKNL